MMLLLRRAVLKFLKATACDIRIAHHWVPNRSVLLNSFKHKGYWYKGRSREIASMELFATLVSPGMTVAEVGGHIGYISMYFSFLVGPDGRVVVFEPGTNNLPYIRSNLSSFANTTLVEKGVGAENGVLELFEESLTGQNNSFVADFPGLSLNRQVANVEVTVQSRLVDVAKLDDYFKSMIPDFIKIDVEGFEYQVLLGSKWILTQGPMFMIEVQTNRAEIFSLFRQHGYVMFDESRKVIEAPDGLHYNTFCLHSNRHRDRIAVLVRP